MSTNRICSLCGTEIAMYPCTHALITASQVTMSRQEWERMTAELNGLRDLAYNVRDFGAMGDGVTDDTAAIQDAIDQAAKPHSTE